MRNNKSLLMLITIFIGALLSKQIEIVNDFSGQMLSPFLLFSMLFVTFCSVDLRDLRFSMMHVWIVIFQIVTGVGTYYLLLPFGEVIAQGVMICLLTPVAMAAVVICQMLGGSVITIASFSVFCNVVMALFIPVFFTHIGGEGCSFSMILAKVAPLMVLPPLVAQLLRFAIPSITSWFTKRSYISYYLWLVALTISIGRTVTFISDNKEDIELWLGIALAIGALVTCLLQYRMGNYIGAKYGDPIAGQQSMGQKNTILGIWMMQTFLSPIASIAPTAYIIWQNILNSYMIYKYKDKK
ncbi:MAG: transporter [Rikenellaceae bacterium]